MDFASMLIRLPGILFGLTIHEYAHGLVALWRGDPTAQQAGRLSFNPLAHLDVFGTLMLLFGPFGWAKPVPVNYYNLNKPKSDSVLVSIAGPVSNIICAFILGFILRIIMSFPAAGGTDSMAFLIIKRAFEINIGLSFFNLLPIPPLDGSNIVLGLLPNKRIGGYLKIMRHVPMIFFVLIVVEWFFHIPTISFILYPLYIPYFSFFQFIIFGGKVL
jgi:Zn-dependent protease